MKQINRQQAMKRVSDRLWRTYADVDATIDFILDWQDHTENLLAGFFMLYLEDDIYDIQNTIIRAQENINRILGHMRQEQIQTTNTIKHDKRRKSKSA